MKSLRAISNRLNVTRCLLSKLTLSETICKAAAAGTHTLTGNIVTPSYGPIQSDSKQQASPASPLHISRRFRARKILMWPVDYLPFPWSYPAKHDRIAQSGDLVNDIGPVDLSRPRDGFELSEELRTATDDVRRLFSLEFGVRRDVSDVYRRDFVQRVQRHPYDTESIEYKIAKQTFAVRCMKIMFARNPKRKNLKGTLCETIDRRNKMLKFLRRWDYRRFNFVVQKLELAFRPAPLGTTPEKKSKKGDLRRLTREYCDNVRRKRLNEFYEKLKAQREDFLKEKREFEEWLASEEEKWRLTEEERAATEYTSILKDIKHTL